MIDLLQNGQGVLNILPLGAVVDEVDEKLVELFPSQASGAQLEATSTDAKAAAQ